MSNKKRAVARTTAETNYLLSLYDLKQEIARHIKNIRQVARSTSNPKSIGYQFGRLTELLTMQESIHQIIDSIERGTLE